MEIKEIIILTLIIIVCIVVLRFITKNFFKIIGIIVVIGIILFFLFLWKGGLIKFGQDEFVLIELQNEYCGENYDTVYCDCIINPLLKDILSEYNLEELNEIRKDNLKTAKIIYESIRRNKKDINKCLNKNKSGSLWKEFIESLKNNGIKEEDE